MLFLKHFCTHRFCTLAVWYDWSCSCNVTKILIVLKCALILAQLTIFNPFLVQCRMPVSTPFVFYMHLCPAESVTDIWFSHSKQLGMQTHLSHITTRSNSQGAKYSKCFACVTVQTSKEPCSVFIVMRLELYTHCFQWEILGFDRSMQSPFHAGGYEFKFLIILVA